MTHWLERTEVLIELEGIMRLQHAHVLIVGLGGVGSFAAEFIARAGVGAITLVDGDQVDLSNINRQLNALHSTIGLPKTTVLAERIRDINPNIQLTTLQTFLSPEKAEEIIRSNTFDYVLDCIDSISPKFHLLYAAKKHKIKIVSAMGAGGKFDPQQVCIRDISKTKNCLLAKQIRKRLKKAGVQKGIRCVFSTEPPKKESLVLTDGTHFKKSYYGTISYMPALLGLFAASEVIRKLLNNQPKS